VWVLTKYKGMRLGAVGQHSGSETVFQNQW
jgi:hypothetical protein